MQYRSSRQPVRQLDPIPLPAEFPVHFIRDHTLGHGPADLLHRHDCLEIGFCHTGAGIFLVEEKILPFTAGDFVVISDQEMHIARSASGIDAHWSFLQLDPQILAPGVSWMEDPRWRGRLAGPAFANILPGRDHADLSELLRTMVKELVEHRAGYRDVFRGLLRAWLGKLQRALPDVIPVDSGEGEGGLASRIAPALAHISQHYAEPIRVDDLASMCHMSESTLRRHWIAATGKSPQAYWVAIRMTMARTLLEHTDRPISEIALDVGYTTLSSFHRHWSAHMPAAPRVYRQKLQSVE